MSASSVANGDIYGSRFLKRETSGVNLVTACGAGEQPIGISTPGARRAPWEAIQDTKLAIDGENVSYYDDPTDKSVMLELGGTVTVGDLLKATTAGKGITASSNNDKVGARAEASGVDGDVIPVTIVNLHFGA